MSDNMKIQGKGLLGGQEATLQQAKSKSNKEQQTGIVVKDSVESGADRVNLGLGQAISRLLAPEKIEQDRHQHFLKIKELVEKKQYTLDSDKVAGALAEEIAFEVAWNAGREQVEE